MPRFIEGSLLTRHTKAFDAFFLVWLLMTVSVAILTSYLSFFSVLIPFHFFVLKLGYLLTTIIGGIGAIYVAFRVWQWFHPRSLEVEPDFTTIGQVFQLSDLAENIHQFLDPQTLLINKEFYGKMRDMPQVVKVHEERIKNTVSTEKDQRLAELYSGLHYQKTSHIKLLEKMSLSIKTLSQIKKILCTPAMQKILEDSALLKEYEDIFQQFNAQLNLLKTKKQEYVFFPSLLDNQLNTLPETPWISLFNEEETLLLEAYHLTQYAKKYDFLNSLGSDIKKLISLPLIKKHFTPKELREYLQIINQVEIFLKEPFSLEESNIIYQFKLRIVWLRRRLIEILLPIFQRKIGSFNEINQHLASFENYFKQLEMRLFTVLNTLSLGSLVSLNDLSPSKADTQSNWISSGEGKSP